MQALTGLDASFLYLETPNSPMHVGGLAIIEGSLEFEAFRDILKSRLHLIPSFTQRLVQVPLSLDYPYWIDDPNFNLDWHLHHTALPEPGDWTQLRKLASRLFSQPLNRNRPLWEIVFVEGINNIPQVPPGSVAIISKVHHAAIDGMSGADINNIIYDMTPEPRVFPQPTAKKIESVPSDIELVRRSAVNFIKRPLKLPKLLLDTATSTVKAGFLTRVQSAPMPTLPFTAPKTILNGQVSADRTWDTALLSLDRIKAIKNIIEGTTVNDVILAACAGALRRYLKEKNALPEKPLVAMVPVSTRSQDEKNTMGNQVSSMFIPLATQIEDPIERLKLIHEQTRSGKIVQKAVNAKSLVQYSELIPFGLAGTAARLYTRANLSKLHNPVFNLVITNVPGPQVPIYLGGKQLLTSMGMAPVMDGMGLLITVLSYNGVVSLSPISSRNIMPDMNKFARYLRESANELEALVLASDEAKVAASKEVPLSDIAPMFQFMASYLAKNPDLKLPSSDIYQFQITGEQAQNWVFDLQNTPARIYEGAIEEAKCTLTMKDKHFAAMAAGKLKGTAAFMQGKMKVKGDVNAAIKFGKVLEMFPKG
ncbi:MAG: wax ester/triacylglycerol synthase family O-acyltransferase [Chitinophagales bacterium]